MDNGKNEEQRFKANNTTNNIKHKEGKTKKQSVWLKK